MDEDYFLTPSRLYAQSPIIQGECKKHGKQVLTTLGHRHFCPHCIGDHLEKAIGQAVVK